MLRPESQGLWQSLPPEEQLRFRRHAERFWNVHRHRMAPAVAAQVHKLGDSGIFRSFPGRVVAIEPSPHPLQLQVKLHSIELPYRWETDWLVNCTGPSTFAFTDDRPLAQSLRRRGLARPGHLDVGIDTDAGGRVLTAVGTANASGCGHSGRSARANCSNPRPCLRSGRKRSRWHQRSASG